MRTSALSAQANEGLDTKARPSTELSLGLCAKGEISQREMALADAPSMETSLRMKTSP